MPSIVPMITFNCAAKMHLVLMPFFMLNLVLDAAFSNPASVIPTKEEQSSLLRNVEEVFTTVQAIVTNEGLATDEAVIGDVHKIVDRALNHLALVEELALTKLSCSTSENSRCRKNATPKIQKVAEEGEHQLQQCIELAASNIHNNSQVVTTTVGAAMSRGQVLLETLNRCSKKVGLQQISCYKKIMTNDVFPLKLILVDALNMHKMGHLEAISIRKGANDCVDQVLKDYQARVAEILSEVQASCA